MSAFIISDHIGKISHSVSACSQRLLAEIEIN